MIYIAVIVSCCIGVTYEYIAPKGSAERNNLYRHYALNKTDNMYNSDHSDPTTILHRVNNTFATLYKGANRNLEKALLEDPQNKNSEINERAFIYIKSVKPAQNNIFEIYKSSVTGPNSELLHRGPLFEDVARNFFEGYMKKGYFKVKGSDEIVKIKPSYVSFNEQKPSEDIFATEPSGPSDAERRDYLELLKVPLLRSLVKNNDAIKTNNESTSESPPIYKNESKVELKTDELDTEVVETNKQVDKFIEQIISNSIEKQLSGQKATDEILSDDKNCDDCINQVHIHTMCQCSPPPPIKQTVNRNYNI